MSNIKFNVEYSESYTMPRPINLRQIEVFKAMIENGTVSRAAEVISISQPAASKLLVHFESDTGLKLFDRNKSRLTPTTVALRLYDEIDRIFAGVREVENVIETVRREDQGQLRIGVTPALGDTFIQPTTMNFLKNNPKVYCSIRTRTSLGIVEHIRTRNIDVGLVSSRVNDPHLISEQLLEHPFICIMPKGHPLTKHKVIQPEHLSGVPFISFKGDTYIEQKIARIFEKYNVKTNVVLTADASPTLRQFVAGGLGVSLVHPLFIAGIEDQLVARPFEPSTPFNFLLYYARDARNADLISQFTAEVKETAKLFMQKFTYV